MKIRLPTLLVTTISLYDLHPTRCKCATRINVFVYPLPRSNLLIACNDVKHKLQHVLFSSIGQLILNLIQR